VNEDPDLRAIRATFEIIGLAVLVWLMIYLLTH
jgi:hypothetical protein